MKVAIVGMLGRQEKEIPVHEYRNLDIRFGNKGRKYGMGNSALFSQVDRIFVMTKFVSHSLTETLDRSKTTLIHGGFNKLRDALQVLNTTARLEEQAHKPVLTMAEAEEEQEMKRLDFNILKDAKPGDVFEFPRPPTLTLDKWELRIAQTRTYYKTNHGVITDKPVFKDNGRVELLVTERRSKTAPAEDVKTDTLAGPAPATATEPASPARVQPYSVDRQFWMDVYLQSMRNNPGNAPSWHKEAADAAVTALWNKLDRG